MEKKKKSWNSQETLTVEVIQGPLLLIPVKNKDEASRILGSQQSPHMSNRFSKTTKRFQLEFRSNFFGHTNFIQKKFNLNSCQNRLVVLLKRLEMSGGRG